MKKHTYLLSNNQSFRTSKPIYQHQSKKSLSVLLALIISLILFSTGLQAQTTTWTGNLNSDWFEASNWSSGIPNATTTRVNIPNKPNDPIIRTGETVTTRAINVEGGVLTIEAGGILDLDNAVNEAGCRVAGGTLNNAGTIMVDNTSGTSAFGFANGGTTNNTGLIEIGVNGGNIGNSVKLFIDNLSGIVNNEGIIRVEGGAVSFLLSGVMTNKSCGQIFADGSTSNYNNLNNFINNGYLRIEGTMQPLTNNGILEDVNGNNNAQTVNNATIVAPISSPNCSFDFSNAVENVTPNDFTIGTTWYLDAALSNAAGTYDPATNTFTANNNMPAGASPVYMEITDDVNGCSRTVSLEATNNGDKTAPSINCPSNISVNNDPGLCVANVTYSTPVGTDNCSATTSQVQGIASGNNFPVGTTTNTFEVTDGNLTDQCTFTVTINDTEPPVFTYCPSNISEDNDAGSCDAVVNFDMPTATDNCAIGIQGMLATNYNSNNGQRGVMFDVTANSTLNISKFDANLYAGTTANYEIYYKSGSFFGSENNANAWTFVGSATGITSLGNNVPTPLPITVNVTIPAGETYGFYITNDFGGGTSYTDINSASDLLASNSDMTIEGGVGKSYPFGLTFNFRGFNGTIHYGGGLSVTQTQGPASGSSFSVGTTAVNYQATDGSGNMVNCAFDVTVNDTEDPNAICQDISIDLDAAGSASITAAQIDNGSSDICGTANLSASQTNFGCGAIGPNTVTLTVNDGNGNDKTCTATVTVNDITEPTAVCQNISIDLDATGSATINAAQIDNGSSDNCATNFSADQTSFDCANVGDNTVTLTVDDGNGNSKTCTATVTINDITEPTAVCQNISIDLDAAGSATITAAQIDNGSSDICETANLSANQTSFSCADIGANTITLTVDDGNGNSNSCNATVTINDITKPTAVCQNISIDLDATGSATINAAQIDNGSSDICGTANLSASQTSFSCADIGANTITLTVDDGNGNSKTCNATVTINDITKPTAVCQNISIDLDATGSATINAAQIDNGSSDNCGTTNLSASQTSFNCGDIGANTITLTVDDGNGNSKTCSSNVTVNDPLFVCCTAPTAICQNISVDLDGSGNATITAAQLDNGSSVNCGTVQLSATPTGFDCSNAGTNTVTLTVTDASGGTDDCISTVTVNDPLESCCPYTNQIYVDIDATGNNDGTSWADAFTDLQPALDGTCGGVTEIWVAEGTYIPTERPNINQTGDRNKSFHWNKNLQIYGGFDGTETARNQRDFGNNITILSGEIGAAGNSDNTLHVVVVGSDSRLDGFTIEGGNANQSTSSWYAGQLLGNYGGGIHIDNRDFSIANCILQNNRAGQLGGGIALYSNKTLTVEKCIFRNNLSSGGGGVATNFGTLNVSNSLFEGNSSGVGGGIRVRFTSTLNAFNLTFDGNSASLGASIYGEGTSTSNLTNCIFQNGLREANNATINIKNSNVANSNGSGAGWNTNFGNDLGGNIDEDPLFVDPANGDYSLQDCSPSIDAGIATGAPSDDLLGNPRPSGADHDMGAYEFQGTPTSVVTCYADTDDDNYGDATDQITDCDTCPNGYVIDDTDCDDDDDTINPGVTLTITCPDNISVNVAPGTCAQTATYSSYTTSDNCKNPVVTQTAGLPSGASFPEGTTINTFTVTDDDANTASCSFNVIVIDNEVPTANCQNTSVDLDASGNATITASQIDNSSSDNCGTANLSASKTAFDCSNVGTNSVTLTVDDGNGNDKTCTAIVTINDTTKPNALCQNTSIQLDANNSATLLTSQIDNNSSDNCNITSMSLSQTTFSCDDLGSNSITLTVNDVNGNSETCTATVTILDDTNPCCAAPVAICKTFSTYVQNDGTATISQTDVNDNSTAECGLKSMTLDVSNFDCSHIGSPQNVTLTVTDINDDSDNCTAIITVLDNINPTITCPADVSVNTDLGDCQAINVTLGTAATADNCPGESVSNDAIAAYAKGQTMVTWTVTDASQNTMTCVQTVTVSDFENPTITCPADVAVNTDLGDCQATNVTLGTAATADNCPGESVSNDAVAAYPKGQSMVTWTVTDASQNTMTCVQTVTVSDNENPTITCPADVAVNTDLGDCQATNVTLGTAAATDNCPSESVSNDAVAAYAKGTTMVTWTVTDASQNTMTCVQTVTVSDNENPTITCPADVAVNTDVGDCQATNVTLGTAVATDNCPSESVSNDAVAAYAKGTTTVTWTVTDASQNTMTCVQTVTVSDNENPTITCPADVAVNTDVGDCQATNVTLGTAATADNCPGESVSNDAISAYAKGQTMVTWTVTDASQNTMTCVQTVTVSDNENPTIIQIASPKTVECNGAGNTDELDFWLTLNGGATATDNCELTWSNDFNGFTDDCGLTGEATVTFTATDNAGNESSTTATFVIEDTQRPEFDQYPTDLTMSCREAIPTAEVITASDICNGFAPSVEFDEEIIDQHCYGTYTIQRTWTTEDECGNIESHVRNIYIEDNDAPIFVTTPNAVTIIECVDYETDIPSPMNLILDDCDPKAYVYDIRETDEYYSFNQGPVDRATKKIVREYFATDDCGNVSSITEIFYIIDTNAPELLFCPEDVNIDVVPGATGAYISFPEPEFYDDCGYYTLTNSASEEGDWLEAYESVTITITAYDEADNSTDCEFIVTAGDEIYVHPIEPIRVSVPTGSSFNSNIVNWNEVFAKGCDECNDIEQDGNFQSGFDFLGEFNGHRYFISKNKVDADAITGMSGQFAGYPVIINSADENRFLNNELGDRSALIGLNDVSSEGSFEWEDGSPLNYVNWAVGQPLTDPVFAESSDYVEMTVFGNWKNVDERAQYFILEIPCYTVTEGYSTPPTSHSAAIGGYEIGYNVTDICGNEDTTTVFVNVVPNTVEYCYPNKEKSRIDEDLNHYITGVYLDGWAIQSGNEEGYFFNDENTAHLKAGNEYQLQLTSGNEIGTSETIYYRVWIDFNSDGDFYDDGEIIYEGFSATGNIKPHSITLPGDKWTPGLSTTLMRVAGRKYDYPEACGEYQFGETEDYPVRIIRTDKKGSSLNLGGNNSETENPGLEIFPNPAYGYVYVKLNEFAEDGNLITVTNSVGKIVYVKSISDSSDSTHRIELNNFPSGIYSINLKVNNEYSVTERLIVTEK